MISNSELDDIEKRASLAQPGPWKAFIEGRDHESGNDFIMTGSNNSRGEDLEISGATQEDYDFIANARQDIPRLLIEIRELKKLVSQK